MKSIVELLDRLEAEYRQRACAASCDVSRGHWASHTEQKVMEGALDAVLRIRMEVTKWKP